MYFHRSKMKAAARWALVSILAGFAAGILVVMGAR